MESGRNNRNRAVALVVVLWLTPIAARATEERQPPIEKLERTTVVYTNSDSAVVEAEQQGVSAPTTVTHKRKSNCHLEAISTTGEIKGVGEVSLPTPPDERPFWVMCDGENVGMVWRKIGPRPLRASPPAQIADSLREEIPMPQVTIRVNPDVGLVGTESWFWVEGYAGQPIVKTTDAFGQTVEVEATVSRYEWAFGDGTSIAGSLGKAYPQRSDVRHVYEKSSSAGAGYPLTVRFVFSVKYRLGGGTWTDLPGIARTASFSYQVRQSQAVIER